MTEHSPYLTAPRLFAANVQALLRLRGQSQRDLAAWCRHSEVWISKILRCEREARMKDLDRMADFFGLATYQLFQPGLTKATERRRGGDRRSGQDRRLSHEHRQMREVEQELERVRPRGRFRVKKPVTKEVG